MARAHRPRAPTLRSAASCRATVGFQLQQAKIALVGIDVDGTLLGPSGIVHPSVWKAAEEARQRGIHLALCSGRPAFGVALGYARQLEPTGWHIFQNGASIVDLGSGASRSVALPRQCVAELIRQAHSSEDVLELYGDHEYVTESHAEWARQHAELLGVPFAPRPFASLQQPVVRAQWLLSRERAREFTARPHDGLEVAQSGSPLMPDTQFVGLTRAGISKGSALAQIATQLGIELADVMYVGDSGNDLSALQIVGHPVAMANAERCVLEAADHRVSDAERGGVAQALELAIAGAA